MNQRQALEIFASISHLRLALMEVGIQDASISMSRGDIAHLERAMAELSHMVPVSHSSETQTVRKLAGMRIIERKNDGG